MKGEKMSNFTPELFSEEDYQRLLLLHDCPTADEGGKQILLTPHCNYSYLGVI